MIATTSKKQVLIIEDHDSLRWLLGSLLSKKFDVTTKKDGWEGMAWLGSGNIPDLILLDLNMPRIGGSEFLKNIRNSGFYRDIPVIVLSGNEDNKDVENCFDLGANEYIKKPFNPTQLNRKINTVFSRTQIGVS